MHEPFLNKGDQWNEPGFFSIFGFPRLELKQILQGSFDLISEFPTFNPNFILDGILLFWKFAITCAARLSFEKLFEVIISLRFILVNFFSLLLFLQKSFFDSL